MDTSVDTSVFHCCFLFLPSTSEKQSSIPYILFWTSAHKRNSIYSVRFTDLRVSQIKKLNAHIPHFDALDRDKERPPK